MIWHLRSVLKGEKGTIKTMIVTQSLKGMKCSESNLELTLLGTPWNSLRGPLRPLDHTLEINNLA